MDKLNDIHDRIQTFRVHCDPKGAAADIRTILDLLDDLVSELRRIDANLKSLNEQHV